MKKMSLTMKIFIGFVVGVLLGVAFKDKMLAVKPIGDIFLTLIRMTVVPLVFFSIISGVASIGDIGRLRKIGAKTVFYFLATTAIAGVVGLLMANLIKPGAGLDLSILGNAASKVQARQMPTLGATLLGMFPSNPFEALVKGNLMQIIVFCLFAGTGLMMAGESGRRVITFCGDCAQGMYKLTAIVMSFSPYGVCALMAASIGQYGLGVFGPLGKFIASVWIADIVVAVIMYGIMLKFVAKIPLGSVLGRISDVWMMTLSTTSSAGTLPVTIKTTQEKFGVSSELSDFILPLGATMNMNGAGVYYSMAVVFVSQIYGVNIPLPQMALLVAIVTIISVGSPGIPGGGIVMTIMLLSTMGLPMEIMALIAGVYRLLDMANTTMNVTGDVVTAVCIARGENAINDAVYKD